MSGVKRSIRYWNWIGFRVIGLAIAFAVAYGILFGGMDGSLEEMLRMGSYYMVIFGMLMGIAIQVSAAQCYLQQCFSMGCKRKDAFIGLQYTNLLIPVVLYLLAFVIQRISENAIGFYDWNMDTSKRSILLMYIVGTLIIEGVGNIVGMFCFRFGKAGLVIFLILMLGLCGGVGASFVMLCNGDSFPKAAAVLLGNGSILIVAAILVYVVCSFLQYRMIQKYEIHA